LVDNAPNPSNIRIWQTVQLIPYGKVATYGQIADLAGLPGRARLIGKALGKVPECGWQGQAVPWFRVINSQGKISFPVESELFDKQKNHLQDEQVIVTGKKINLADFQWQPDLTEMLFKLDY
jgi:methylated-DNA-protein-cysteine methyltransferase-like protein